MRKHRSRLRDLRELEAFALRELEAAARKKLAEERREARTRRKAVKAACDAGVGELRSERAELVARRASLDDGCRRDKRQVREEGRARVAGAEASLRHQRARRRKEKAPKLRRSSREARDESDDAVKKNLPAELVAIFERVRSRIVKTPRMSRTEAFLHWVEEHPDEVRAIEAEAADDDAARMWREHQATG